MCRGQQEPPKRSAAGRIVNTAYAAIYNVDAYGAFKAAVHAFTQSFALELKDFGVSVNALRPSIIDRAANRRDTLEAEFAWWIPAVTDPQGHYRRRVLISTNATTASVDMEDDCHRFGVDIWHDGSRVIDTRARALRTPWSICAQAESKLRELRGVPLLDSPFAVLRLIRLAEHCTHMIDMGALALAAAKAAVGHRIYDVILSTIRTNGVDIRRGTSECSGRSPVSWLVENGVIARPARLAGLEMRRSASWAAASLDSIDDIEALFVVQRAVLVAGGRWVDLDTKSGASDISWMMGACFAFSRERASDAIRNVGASRDFTPRPDDLLGDVLRPKVKSDFSR